MTSRNGTLRRMLWMPLALALVPGCGDQPLENSELRAGLNNMAIVSGNGQTGMIGAQLPQPLVVLVTDGAGNPISKQVVNFHVTKGGGSVFAGVALTDENGRAQEWWTLGREPGDNSVEARAVDTASGEKVVFANFTARGVNDTIPPARPANPAVTVAPLNADSFAVAAAWGHVAEAVTYDWSTGTNSGSWKTQGSVDTSRVEVKAPRLDEEYWLCVRSVDAAGNRSVDLSCNTFTAPADGGSEAPQPGPVASVAVSPASSTLNVGESVQLSATLRDAGGNLLTGRSVTWSSSNASVATVSSSGVVDAVQGGSVTITASSEGVTASATAEVIEPTSGSSEAFFIDGFETGDLSNQMGGFRWSSGVNVSSTRARSGSRSLEFVFGPNGPGQDDTAEQRFSHPALQEYWVEYYMYIPSNYFHRRDGTSSNNNKFYAFWGPNGYSKPGMGTFQTWAMSEDGESDINVGRYGPNDTYMNYPEPGWGDLSPFLSSADNSSWVRIRIHLRLADPGARNGIQQLWKNNSLIVDVRNDNNSTGSSATNFYNSGYLLGWSNSGFAQETRFYIDDFRMYSTNPGW